VYLAKKRMVAGALGSGTEVLLTYLRNNSQFNIAHGGMGIRRGQTIRGRKAHAEIHHHATITIKNFNLKAEYRGQSMP
jgi:hypothetical protein